MGYFRSSWSAHFRYRDPFFYRFIFRDSWWNHCSWIVFIGILCSFFVIETYFSFSWFFFHYGNKEFHWVVFLGLKSWSGAIVLKVQLGHLLVQAMAAPMAESHSNNIVEVVIFYVDPTCFGQENKFIGGKERKRVSVKKTDVNVFRTFCSILKEQTGLVEEALQRGLGKEVEVKISRLEKTKEGVKTYGISTQATWELELPEIEKGCSLQGIKNCHCYNNVCIYL